jgi:hypothetical protein
VKKRLENGKMHFEFNWSFDNIALCRNSYTILFDISKYRLDECSAAFKLSENRRVSPITQKEWKDNHVHAFTFVDTEQMMKKNTFCDVIGKDIFKL